MKHLRLTGIFLIIGLLVSTFNVKKAEAMNNESAALLAGAIALFGKPILQSIAGEVFYPEPVKTYYQRPATKVIYKKVYVIKHENDDCFRPCLSPRNAYERGWCDELRRIERKEYRRGRRDARRYYYERYYDP